MALIIKLLYNTYPGTIMLSIAQLYLFSWLLFYMHGLEWVWWHGPTLMLMLLGLLLFWVWPVHLMYRRIR